MDGGNVEAEVKEKTESEESIEDFVRRIAEESGQDYDDLIEAVKQAAKEFGEITGRFGDALFAEIVEIATRKKETQKDWKFVGFHLPESVLKSLDERRQADGQMTRSEYVRSAVKIYLRMSGLTGEELRKQLDLILDEAMADRFGIAIQAALAALGPEVSKKLIDGLLVTIFGAVANAVKVDPKRVEEKIMGALQELRMEGAVAAHQTTSQQAAAEIADANGDG